MLEVYRTPLPEIGRGTVQSSRMPLWKLTLSYDGATFHGWQIQPGLATVQGALASAIHRITGETVLPQGSGRTDAGVHALAQVASLSLASAIPPPNLQRALNRILPGSIRVLSAHLVDPPFHARHSALRKTYEYRIFPAGTTPPGHISHPDAHILAEPRTNRPSTSRSTPVRPARICPPTLAPYVWDLHLPLDLDLLDRAAAHILGRHDFTSFAAAGADLPGNLLADPLPGYPAEPPSTCRVIHASAWRWQQDLLVYRVTGSGFLHHMVRNLVGTFVHAGAGRSSPDAIPAILDARSRSAAGATAPARGLFLVEVEYP